MKIALRYISDEKGKKHAVQLPLTDWKKILNRIKKYEQALQLKSDLTDAFAQVSLLRKTKEPKQTLNDFLDELLNCSNR